jgi:hypothetical protein
MSHQQAVNYQPSNTFPLALFYPEDGGDTFLRNAGATLQKTTFFVIIRRANLKSYTAHIVSRL